MIRGLIQNRVNTLILNTITVCAEAYRYNFLLDCTTYQRSVEILNPLFDELAEFSKS